MSTYEVTGHIAEPFEVLTARAIGDTFSADLDPDVESLLVAAGAVRKVEAPKRKKEEAHATSRQKAR